MGDPLDRAVLVGDDRPRCPMPRSMPQRAAGSAGMRGRWATIAWTDTTSRPPCSARVIDRTLARPLATSRSSRRVFSWERSLPITGTTRWRQPGSRRIAPVMIRTRPRSRRRALKRGNSTGRPARRPALASDQFRSLLPSPGTRAPAPGTSARSGSPGCGWAGGGRRSPPRPGRCGLPHAAEGARAVARHARRPARLGAAGPCRPVAQRRRWYRRSRSPRKRRSRQMG
jgi:hypothetical protein